MGLGVVSRDRKGRRKGAADYRGLKLGNLWTLSRENVVNCFLDIEGAVRGKGAEVNCTETARISSLGARQAKAIAQGKSENGNTKKGKRFTCKRLWVDETKEGKEKKKDHRWGITMPHEKRRRGYRSLTGGTSHKYIV